MLLARQGRRVLLVDRSQYGTDTLSTHALMRAGVLQLHRWGLLPRIIEAGTPPVRRTTFHYGGEPVVVQIKNAFGVDALYAPRRTVLDPALVDAAAEAGVDVRFGVSVTDVRRNANGRVTGIVGLDEHRDPFEASALITIGADGIRSTIAERVQAPILREGIGATANAYGYWSGVEADGYEWHFRPTATAGFIPTNDGAVCVFAGTSPARFRHEIAGDVRTGFLALLDEAAPGALDRLAGGRPPQQLRTFPGRRGYLRRAWGPGWALVGDAGYYKDPISAHGITDALRDAELLAGAVERTLSGAAPEAVALADFQATRDRLSLALFETVDTIAASQWSADEIPGLLLTLSSAMVDEVEALAARDEIPAARPLVA
jgi:2-polyprenyl-6-methoxyphenol hydroxylase-like FAD-dependent oxidoreductase